MVRTEANGEIRREENNIGMLSDGLKIFLRQQWPLIALFLSFILAWMSPQFGASLWDYNGIFLSAIFFLCGLSLGYEVMAKSLRRWKLHIGIQAYSLLLTPVTFYCLVYHWGWDHRLGIVTQALSPGVMAALCMVSTAYTNV